MGERAVDGWVRLAGAEELRGPGPFAARAGGHELVLARSDGALRAFEGRCPHQGALLAEGEVAEGELVCRNHRWRFELATGRRSDGAGCLRACPLREGADGIFVRPEALSTPAAAARRTVRDLPGPRGLPWLGNLAVLDLERLHLTLERFARRYGRVYRVAFGPKTTVVTSDPGLIHVALRERPDVYRRVATVESVFRELGMDGVFSAEGVDWRPLRRLTMEALSPAHLRSFFPALRRVAERLRRRWSRSAAEGRAVDLLEDLKRFTVDVTMQLAFGHDLDTLQQEGDDVLQRRLELVFPGLNRRLFATVPLWRVVKVRAERRLEDALGEVFALLRGLLVATRARLAAEPTRAAHPATFLEAMACARDEAGRPYGDAQILGNALQILLAGEDTTALTLTWAAHELCDAPAALAALQAEADAVLGDATAPTDFEAAGRLAVAGAVASETMRLRPVAPLFFMETNVATVLGDVALPARQRLCLLTRPPAASAERFGEPEAFRPERWLGAAPGAHDASAVLPFGSGPRLCPGRSLALLEMRVVLATLARSFGLERAGPRAAVEERFAFTMGPRGLRVRLRERGPREGRLPPGAIGVGSSP